MDGPAAGGDWRALRRRYAAGFRDVERERDEREPAPSNPAGPEGLPSDAASVRAKATINPARMANASRP